MSIKTQSGDKMSATTTKFYMLRGGYGNAEVRFYHDTVLNKVMIHQISFGTLNDSFTIVPTGGIFASSALTIGSDVWYDLSVAEAVWETFVAYKPEDNGGEDFKRGEDFKPWVRVDT